MKHSFFSNKVQEIHTTPAGEVTYSNDTIYTLEQGTNIKAIHPFFESLGPQLSEVGSRNLAFPCVQLDLNGEDHICDITIKKERGDVAILLFDYTSHYKHLHEAAQEKKNGMLNEQAFELNARHQEKQKAYFEYIRDRIDTKIINELESVIQTLSKLKQTELSQEQDQLIIEIEKDMKVLHNKAMEVKQGLILDLE